MPQFEISKTPPSSSKMEVALPPQIPNDLTAVKADVIVIKSRIDANISTVLTKIDALFGNPNPYNLVYPEVVNKRFTHDLISGNCFCSDGYFMDSRTIPIGSDGVYDISSYVVTIGDHYIELSGNGNPVYFFIIGNKDGEADATTILFARID